MSWSFLHFIGAGGIFCQKFKESSGKKMVLLLANQDYCAKIRSCGTHPDLPLG
jgi:hypothetical protein